MPEVGRFGPFIALTAAITGVTDLGVEGVELLPRGLAILAMLGWIGAAYAAGAVLLRRRDLE